MDDRLHAVGGGFPPPPPPPSSMGSARAGVDITTNQAVAAVTIIRDLQAIERALVERFDHEADITTPPELSAHGPSAGALGIQAAKQVAQKTR